ncbi:hypothetical protein Bhyg_02804 [Pseudolycoriella hygida]|uniref:Uncharacterized protein n=1 Tax=Pseudolycoriella hygida TaxID=35572 RepID=A0A9Q0NDP2_9DIPT|nr:hypothetical protein Bhyg_02804 [Pseudolycoriella hygida]
MDDGAVKTKPNSTKKLAQCRTGFKGFKQVYSSKNWSPIKWIILKLLVDTRQVVVVEDGAPDVSEKSVQVVEDGGTFSEDDDDFARFGHSDESLYQLYHSSKP